jgi:hypothetical protein
MTLVPTFYVGIFFYKKPVPLRAGSMAGSGRDVLCHGPWVAGDRDCEPCREIVVLRI